MTNAVRNFHLPLPERLYHRLREVADETNRPATVVARYAIESWLRQQQRAALREAIATYAGATAGSRDDLDPELEAAALEAWRSPKKRRRAR